MVARLLSGPAVEPLTLPEARAWLRVETPDDDDLITALIVSARQQVEAATRRALITQHWRLVRDAWPRDGRIAVRPLPLQAIAAARVLDGDGNATGLDSQALLAEPAAGVIVLLPWAVPQPGRAAAGIEIDVRVGHGDAAADVPEPLRQAMRLMIAHGYEIRGATPGAAGALPQAVAALLAPWRVVTL